MAPDQPLPKRVSENATRRHEAAEHVRERVREVREEVKPQAARLAARRDHSAGPGGRYRAHRAVPTLTTRVGLGGLRGHGAAAVRGLGDLPPRHAGHRGRGVPAAVRPLQHLPADRRLLHPFTLILLDGTQRNVLLAIVWGGRSRAPLFRIFWSDAPRWVYTPIYVALGWVSIFYVDDFAGGGTAVITLIAVGGGLYTLGGLVYGFKKPDPFPTWFGFHEVFHTLTIAAFVCHYVAASIATYQLR